MFINLKALTSLCCNGLLDLVYPPKCLLCEKLLLEGALCEACMASFEKLSPPFCAQCGVPIAIPSSLCSLCVAGQVPPWDWSYAFGRYTGGLRKAIHRLKYGGNTALAAPLAHLLSLALEFRGASSAMPLAFDLVVPVPLHPKRLRQRGYNQAERIAFYLAKERGWPLEKHVLKRVRFTKTQTSLNAVARRENVSGAFQLTKPDRFKGLSVLVVDDVMTTGSTLGEIAKLLKQAGASYVGVSALARD